MENLLAEEEGKITNNKLAPEAKSIKSAKNRKKQQENEIKTVFERIKMKKKEKEHCKTTKPALKEENYNKNN